MANGNAKRDIFSQEDHQVAYIFKPEGESNKPLRPAKKRKVAQRASKTAAGAQDARHRDQGLFIPLLNGSENQECVQLRQRLFTKSCAKIEDRIQQILRDSNSAILRQVKNFIDETKTSQIAKLPCAFIITGPNIASQDLLFDQLSETLESKSTSNFVRLRSSEVSNLKSVLKKVIRTVTRKASGDVDEDDETKQEDDRQKGKRFLDYDLEALNSFLKMHECEHVYVALQDSEGFDSGLLSDLIHLFESWRPQIPFTLLFGIATSVELLQARLLKSACRQVHGAQFDGVQTESILETVFKGAVAASDVCLRLGPSLLRWMLERQRDYVAGIQSFISSLKYAYMCHFYANPLSILLSADVGHGDLKLQDHHFEAIRNTSSFQNHVESTIEMGTTESMHHAKSLLDDNSYLLVRVRAGADQRRDWMDERLRSLLMIEAARSEPCGRPFSDAYLEAMGSGVSMEEDSEFVQHVRKLNTEKLESFLVAVIELLKSGEPSLRLAPATREPGASLQTGLEVRLGELRELKAKAREGGATLRSKYSQQGKVMRTTVIAQRVQLSQDSATLNEDDKQLTSIVDGVTSLLSCRHDDFAPRSLFLSEGWLYDHRVPSRDVFVPRPRTVFERSLSRPHDYLSCACCKPGEDGIQGTLPTTSILYQLYQETGGLINVADLLSAFLALVVTPANEEQEGMQIDLTQGDTEREALVMFYKGLAELRALGFVRSSKKKADHVAKVKWM